MTTFGKRLQRIAECGPQSNNEGYRIPKYPDHLWQPWFYAGPYVPSGVIYGPIDSPSASHWLVPGYERAYGNIGIIDLYNPPEWF